MSEPAATPAPAVATPATGGFVDSIDAFFAPTAPPVAVTPEPTPTPEPEPTPTPEPEPTKEPVKEKKEPKEPKEPAKKEDSTVPDLDDLDAGVKDWTPQAAKRFKELKSELKATQARAAELEAAAAQSSTRLAELEALDKNPEYQALQAKIADYEQKVMFSDLEQSTAYQSLVAEPLAALVAESDAVAAKYSIAADELLDVISMTDEAKQEERLTEILAAASDRDKFKVYKLIEEVKPILAQRQTLRENVAAALAEAKALDEQRSQQTLAERARARQTAATSVVDVIRAKMPFLEGVEGVDLDAISKFAAETDPSTLDPVTGTYHAMAAKLLPRVALMNMELQKEIEVLTENLAKYENATPAAGGGRASAASGAVSTDAGGFLDAVNGAFGGR